MPCITAAAFHAAAAPATIGGMQPQLTIDSDRLWQRLETLATFTLPGVPWTRRAFSPEFVAARAWLIGEFEAAGLATRIDAGGNLIGHLPGTEPALPPLVTGSHCDTVVAGGRFDGIVGVLAALEVAQSLREHGQPLRHTLEVVDFLCEEPSDYGISCVGSRAFVGELDAAMLSACNPQGESLYRAMRRVGARPDAIAAAARRPGDIAAFVELHIEQGPVLESEGLPIGVVSHIAGIRRVSVTVTGQPDHAGTTPMHIRRDALAGAARIVQAAYQEASRLDGHPHYVVATVGRLALTPNVPNTVPGEVQMVLEVRSDSREVLALFPEQVLALCEADLAALGLQCEAVPLTSTPPTACSGHVMRAIGDAACDMGFVHRTLASGAGHDAMHVAAAGPVGMIFIPCRGGRSHCPQEWADPAQVVAGTRVLAGALRGLDRALDTHAAPGPVAAATAAGTAPGNAMAPATPCTA